MSSTKIKELARLLEKKPTFNYKQITKQIDGLQSHHPIKILFDEHNRILDSFDKLEILVLVIQAVNKSEALSNLEIDRLKDIVLQLESANNHCQQEENVLFPELEVRGIFRPIQILRTEHIALNVEKNSLIELVNGDIRGNFSLFQMKLRELAGHLILTSREHIFKENYVLFPAALNVIVESESWDRIKLESKAIDGRTLATADWL